MKPSILTPTKSVEDICQLIEQYKLVSSKDYAALRKRWFRPDRKEVADPEQFRKWLVLNRYVTEFLAKVLSGRKSDQLVLNEYRLQDQYISGPMAGAYLALDSLDRPVVIEVLSSRSAQDKSILTGFQQAALKAMKVQHPNVGRIIDAGEVHGFHYLVKEYYEGESLEDILERKGKLPYLQTTRLMALALAGVEALHAAGVPAGDLTADCLLLTPASKESPNHRTVKILHAGVKRRLFDETAIGRSISLVQGIPDELQLAKSCTFDVSNETTMNPPDDIFSLGCVFYRAVTGQAPFAERELPCPTRAAKPIRQTAPDVPEMLTDIIEQMIDPDPAKRQKKAAHVAKALRVFLAADEKERDIQAEEHIVAPRERSRVEHNAPVDEDALEQEIEEDEDLDEEPGRRPPITKKRGGAEKGIWSKAVALWEEIQPEVRDLLFLSGGALGMLLLIFLASVLTGIRITYIAGLFTGAAASYFVDKFIRWRRQTKGLANEASSALARDGE
jgi:serine/threonine protein kinase